MEGGKEEAAQTHPFYPALAYGAFRPHGENPKHELPASLFRTNFYFFRLASELQQPAASYEVGGWGREEESQFIKFYFAVQNVPVALKHFIKKSSRQRRFFFKVSKSLPVKFVSYSFSPLALKAASYYPLLSPLFDILEAWFPLGVSQQEVECTLHIEQIVQQPCHLYVSEISLLPKCWRKWAPVKESDYMSLYRSACGSLKEKKGGKKRNEIPVRKWGRETKTSD